MIRQPPVNPFKAESDEQEEKALPEMPKRIALECVIVPISHRTESSGNGHDAEAGEQSVKDTQSEEEKAEDERKQKEEQDAIDKERREEDEAKIPGNKFLLNVEARHLPETSRLNEREIFTFGVGNVQDAVLDLKRTESVYVLFRDAILRLKISLGGKGRDDFISLHQAEAEENARRGQVDGL